MDRIVFKSYQNSPKRPYVCSGGRTRKSDALHTDINKIMKQYKDHGIIPNTNGNLGFYADISEMGDFQQCLEKTRVVQNAFMQLDPYVRRRFGDDPANLLDFLSDPNNKDEAIKLGLIEKQEEVAVATTGEEIPQN